MKFSDVKTFDNATIEIKTYQVACVPIITNKTWSKLTDSEKQNIASEWVDENVLTNVNQVCELLSHNYDHSDFEDYMQLSERKDFENASKDHLNDLTIDELLEVIEEYDISLYAGDFQNKFKKINESFKKDLFEKIKLSTVDIKTAFDLLNDTLSHTTKKDIKCYDNVDEILNELIDFLSNGNIDNYDDIDNLCLDLELNFDGYLKAYQSDLVTIIENEIDLDQYGKDHDLEPEYDQAYEFYAVTDHFKAMTENDLAVDDILGLTVWARFCFGQSVILDHAIQVAAFKALSDCHYKNY